MASVQDSVSNAASGFLKEQEKAASPAGMLGKIAQDSDIAPIMEMMDAAMPGFKDKINEAIGSLQGASFGDLGQFSSPPASIGAQVSGIEGP